MIDLQSAEGFDWDAGTSRKSIDKHGVSPAEAEQAFFDPGLLVLADERQSAAEPRNHALGRSDDGRRLHITFTFRNEGRLIRVTSARDMHRRARSRYEQDTQAGSGLQG